MGRVILKAEYISKQYRLGLVGTGTLSHDLNRWWHRIRGKEDPYLKIGAANDRSKKQATDYVWALKDINFEVEQGEVLGIIGKNGAGKSTLLKILSRVTSPTTGEIKSRGRIASLLEVGTGFHPELTGRENIYLNGAILGMTKQEIRSKEEEIVDFSGCEGYIDTPVKRYSSGMRVRLAFAVAAFLEPDILVVDEVLAVGDAEFQKKAVGKMQDISQGEGRTVLFVSHNMAAVKSLCTRALVLENGKVVFNGQTESAVGLYLKCDIDSSVSLADRLDRKGDGRIKFSRIEIFNLNEELVDSVISGEFLKLRLFFEQFEDINGKLIFGFEIKDQNEELKGMFVSDEKNLNINSYIDQGYIDIVFDRFMLRGGSYFFKFLISEKDTRKENQLDNLDRAYTLNVLPGDIYNIGRTNRSYNAYFIDCKLE
ncbi:ABC transporter ATP-binding protein [Aegicerativicinus sediminis]|uniref:ABC transporter ATP-binding protein n=1 Tax=Aegicerativicinus sediminis TaxID=2893202 RepID=UPI001E40DF2B|nr:ABC transporter ATP-binding protein [Aegicerativicinus sediminis]